MYIYIYIYTYIHVHVHTLQQFLGKDSTPETDELISANMGKTGGATTSMPIRPIF